jgi:DNA-3-methyladenine glycosylase
VFDRAILEGPAIEVAPRLLGGILTKRSHDGTVSLRITEVEAYLGALDPGSHAFRGPTKRNAVMFGEPGFLYTYFTYGMHVCANIVCSPPGTASAVLLRAGEVVDGVEFARLRRLTSRTDDDLARGPARLVVALGITLADGGADLRQAPFELTLAEDPPLFETSSRTGLSGDGGTDAYPWRYWIPGEASVSPYKAHAPKKRS